jgi:stearoyl-CoA desaturase (delta-9 desaturase)
MPSTPPTAVLVARRRAAVAHRRSSLTAGLVGHAGTLAALVSIPFIGVTAVDLVAFALMYWLTLGLGLCGGYHRGFSHRSFRAGPRMRRVLAVLGSMAGQGPLPYWVAVHRRHHEHADVEGDPHTPNLGRRGLAELWHAHFGWTLDCVPPGAARYCPDVLADPVLVAVGRQYRLWVLVGLAFPAVACGLATGTWRGALGGFLWGGLVRMFLTANATWSLNSFCHRFGARPFATRDQSRNVAWLALPTLGESWHNNHHAHPTSAAHGLRWWQLDVTYAGIRALAALGLVTDVKRPRADQKPAYRNGAASAATNGSTSDHASP